MRTTIFSVLAVVASALADNAANFDRDTAPTSSSAAGLVSQISDGQIQAPTGYASATTATSVSAVETTSSVSASSVVIPETSSVWSSVSTTASGSSASLSSVVVPTTYSSTAVLSSVSSVSIPVTSSAVVVAPLPVNGSSLAAGYSSTAPVAASTIVPVVGSNSTAPYPTGGASGISTSTATVAAGSSSSVAGAASGSASASGAAASTSAAPTNGAGALELQTGLTFAAFVLACFA
ncbi:hypothetical protein LTR08_000495 [Meristemomyces frigidus]|nr:hypothetical protein LTR08_000495 [Meristemomyces frigidus]